MELTKAMRKTVCRFALPALGLALTVGCAKTEITDRNIIVRDKLPRPGNVIVYDFAATKADLPADATISRHVDLHDVHQTPHDLATGRELGVEIATELVKHIRAMGMPAERAVVGTQQHENDLVIRGYLLGIHEGSAAKRVAIGFGQGASELRTAVEGFQVTKSGLRKLGEGSLDAGGAKTPGGAMGAVVLLATKNPAGLVVSTGVKLYGEKTGKSKVRGRADQTAKEIADVLQIRFREQGWTK